MAGIRATFCVSFLWLSRLHGLLSPKWFLLTLPIIRNGWDRKQSSGEAFPVYSVSLPPFFPFFSPVTESREGCRNLINRISFSHPSRRAWIWEREWRRERKIKGEKDGIGAERKTRIRRRGEFYSLKGHCLISVMNKVNEGAKLTLRALPKRCIYVTHAVELMVRSSLREKSPPPLFFSFCALRFFSFLLMLIVTSRNVM